MGIILKRVKLIAMTVLIGLSLVGCNNSNNISNYDAILVSKVTIGDSEQRVYKVFSGQSIMLVDSKGKIKKKEKTTVLEEEASALELPDLSELDGNDITVNKTYFNTTWESTIEKSAQQVRWFIRRGYEVVLQANTQKYIEMYLKRDDTIKRILITPNTISIVDAKQLPTTNPEQYIEDNKLYN